MRRFWSLVSSGAVLVIAVALVAAPAGAGEGSDMDELAKRWMEAYNAGDLEAVAGLYTEDGCRMPPNAEAVHGTEAIHAFLQAGLEMGMAKITVEVTTTESSGEMAHSMGTYEVMNADGEHLDHGKWMNVAKMVDGEWKIACDIWNSDMPMEAPTE